MNYITDVMYVSNNMMHLPKKIWMLYTCHINKKTADDVQAIIWTWKKDSQVLFPLGLN